MSHVGEQAFEGTCRRGTFAYFVPMTNATDKLPGDLTRFEGYNNTIIYVVSFQPLSLLSLWNFFSMGSKFHAVLFVKKILR
jgi:hypothetical protein